MQCCDCLETSANPDELFNHLVNFHGKRGDRDYKCSLCLSVFDRLKSFKTHSRACFLKSSKIRNQAEKSQQNTIINEAFEMQHDLDMEYLDAITDFKESVRKEALDMVLTMSANMNIPRNLVFTQIAGFQNFITNTYIRGMVFIIYIPFIVFNITRPKMHFVLYRFENICGSMCKIE